MDLPTPNKQAKHVSSYKRNGLTWTATWTEDRRMPCLVWFCFLEFGRDTGRCKTQIVVLSIVHETQTQNYNMMYLFSFVCNTRTNKQRFLIPKLVYIQRFMDIVQALLVKWLKSAIDYSLLVGSSPTVSMFRSLQFWPV